MTNFSNDELSRYSRHFFLEGFGETGQSSLKKSRVLIVGLGGLGSSASMAMAASGVGAIDLIDPDHIELSNLQRQIAHTTDRIGESKASSAAKTLLALNPEVQVRAFSEPLTAAWLEKENISYDLILDCVDQFSTRFLINQYALQKQIPWVHAAVIGWQGRVCLFTGQKNAPCFQCVFDESLAREASPRCADSAVFAPLVIQMGAWQAGLAIRALAGDRSEANRLWQINQQTGVIRSSELVKDPGCKICQ